MTGKWSAGMISLVFIAASASADMYQIDTTHAEVGFSIRHMGISNVRGNFGDFSGSIEYDGVDPASLKAEATIQVESIDTGMKKRDDHLRSPDFFDAKAHPEMTFTTTAVEKSGDGFVLKGDLTMHGVTQKIALPMTLAGPIDDPWGNSRIGIEISGTLKRHDWGVGTDGASDKVIGKDVKLDINLEATKK